MKHSKDTLNLALAGGFLIFVASAVAGHPTNWPPNFPTIVKSKEEAIKCCLPNQKVALACKDCKTVTEKPGEDKGILSWFAPDSKHDCQGCGGKIKIKTIGGGRAITTAEYTHTCSKCGDHSAYTCATHKK